VLAAARERSILVGRGSAHYLSDRAGTFHVFIYAPMVEKVRRLQRAGTAAREATELVETTDRDRAAFVKQYFNVEWPDRHLFHLMINSAIGDDAVVETILRGVAVCEEASP